MRCTQSAHGGRSRGYSLLLLVSAFLLCIPGSVAAQPPLGPGLPNPRLLIITPPGGKAGNTFEVAIAGLDLQEPEGLLFSQPGIKVEPIGDPSADPKEKPPKPAPSATNRFKVTINADTPLGI